MTLRLLRVEDEEGSDSSRVALVRGAGMVVRHHKVPGVPLQGGGYRAVLLAGTASGATDADQKIEEFLRAAEPPEHDQWVHHTNALGSRYRLGSRKRLDELWAKIRNAVIEMTSSKPGGAENGPDRLARYFQLGGKSGSSTQKHRFLVEFGSMRFDGTTWTVEGRARRSNGDKPWHLDIDAKLAGESAKVPLTIVSADSQQGEAKIDTKRTLLRLKVPGEVSDIEFRFTAEPADGDLKLASESTLRVDARPHEEV